MAYSRGADTIGAVNRQRIRRTPHNAQLNERMVVGFGLLLGQQRTVPVRPSGVSYYWLVGWQAKAFCFATDRQHAQEVANV